MNVQDNKNIEYYSKLKSTEIKWLWYPYIPYGKITIIQGDPGEGKTSLALYIATILSKGQALPLCENKVEKQNVIYQNREDGVSDTIKPRLERYGANCDNICFILEDDKPLSLNDDRLESAIREANAKVLILDPIQAYLGDSDMVRANDIRPLMNNLCKVAERTGCAILLIGHLNKKDGGKELYRTLGSIDIVAAARSILMVKKPDENDESLRKIVHVKSNLAPKGKSLVFSLENNNLVNWAEAEGVENVEFNMQQLCQQALKELIGVNGINSVDCYSSMEEKGFSRRTVERAKSELGIKSTKRGHRWVWILE